MGVTDVEDYRVMIMITARGWYTVVLYDDGLEVVESVEVD